MRRLVPLSILIALALLMSTLSAAPGRRLITDLDLLDFVWLADPQISSDGQTVAMVRVTVDREHDTYTSQIWAVPVDGGAQPRPLSTGAHDTMPRWSPDGRRLAFLRGSERDGQTEKPQVYVLDLSGGDARPVTRLPEGANGFVWSPDSHMLAVASAVVASTPPVERGRPKATDVRVITRATFRADGAGYRDGSRHSRVFLVPMVDGREPEAARPVRGVRIVEQSPVFSPDGSTVYLTSRDVEETDFAPPKTLVYAAPVAGGQPRLVATIDGTASELTPSPDGRLLAFQGVANIAPVPSYSQEDLFVLDAASGDVRNLTAAYDAEVGGGLSGDQRAPRGAVPEGPVWAPDGSSLVVVSAEQGRANLVRVSLSTGSITPITTGNQEVQAFSADGAGRAIVTLIATPTNVGDLFVLSPGGTSDPPAEPRRITDVNKPLFDALDVPGPHEFWFTSFDGRKIEGWYLAPPGFEPAKKHPMILQIHGGPHAAYGYTFTHEFLAQAARGYVVAYVNPRGSTTYGRDFGNLIQYRYPGDDFTDLMRAVDDLVARGFVDPERLGVTGGSGGGLLTNWAIGHTDRFRAAVSQRSIADWEGWWYSADFTLFLPSWFRKGPWDDRADFAARSPITYADAIHTPLMLVDGDADDRTPPTAGGEAMFRALKMRHVPVVMVRVPNEGHELSRSGRPWHRVDRLRHIASWFDKWIQGKSLPEYDSP